MPAVIAFEVGYQPELESMLSIAAHHNDAVEENIGYCTQREKGQEILACREEQVPYMVFEGVTGEQIDGNVDIDDLPADTRLIWRRNLPGEHDTFRGLKSICPEDAMQRVENWAEWVDHTWTSRDVRQMHFLDAVSYLKANRDRVPIFAKTTEKLATIQLADVYHDVDDILARIDPARVTPFGRDAREAVKTGRLVHVAKGEEWYCEYRGCMQRGRSWEEIVGNPMVILSDPLPILKDGQADNGKAEWRCAIVDHKVSGASRYTDYVSFPVPDSVLDFAQRFAKTYQDTLPPFYALDVAQLENGDLVLVELNNWSKSGRYRDICPHKLARDIHAAYNQGVAFTFKDPVRLPEPAKVAERFDEGARARIRALLGDDSLTLD